MRLLQQIHAWRSGDRAPALRQDLFREGVRRGFGPRIPQPEELQDTNAWFLAKDFASIPLTTTDWRYYAFGPTVVIRDIKSFFHGIAAFPCFFNPMEMSPLAGVVYRITPGFKALMLDRVYSDCLYHHGGCIGRSREKDSLPTRFADLRQQACKHYTEDRALFIAPWIRGNMDLLIEWLEQDLNAKHAF